MAILSKEGKPDKCESHNSLKLSFTNIRGLRSNFRWMWILPWNKLSRHLILHTQLIRQFLYERLFSFNPKRFCYSYAWWYSLCEGRTSFYAGRTSADSYLYFQLALLYSVFYFFFLYQPPSWFTVLNTSSSNIDEILLINPFANIFVFGDFNVHHKDRLTYSGGTDRLVNSVMIFQMTLIRWLTFLLGYLTVTLTVLLFWIYLFLLRLVFVLQWLSLQLSHLALTFRQTQKGMPSLIA